MPTDLGSVLLIAWTSGSARLTTTDGFGMREVNQGDQHSGYGPQSFDSAKQEKCARHNREGEGKEGNARERRGMARGEDKGYEVEGEGELDILLDREERGKCTESYPEPPHINPTPNPQDCFQQPYPAEPYPQQSYPAKPYARLMFTGSGM